MDDLVKVAALIMENWDSILVAVSSIIGGFAVLARFTPTLKDDHILGKLTRFIDAMGQNAGEAANDPKKAK